MADGALINQNFSLIFDSIFFDFIFRVLLLSVLRGHSFFSYPPQWAMTSDFKGFLSQIVSITLFVLSLFFRKSQFFPLQCWVPNKGTSGIIFITSLVWRGHWLGIEPGTSRTRSQHSTARLSRRRLITMISPTMFQL